jgi:hypothetical protein
MRQAKRIGLLALILVLVTLSAVPTYAWTIPGWVEPEPDPRAINVFHVQEEPYFKVYGLVRGIYTWVEDRPKYTKLLNEKRACLETTWLFNTDRLPYRWSFPH